MSSSIKTVASHLPLAKRLTSIPPSERRFAVVCSHAGCGPVWYYYTDWEAWEANSQHQHPNALHVFEYVFRERTKHLRNSHFISAAGLSYWSSAKMTSERRANCLRQRRDFFAGQRSSL